MPLVASEGFLSPLSGGLVLEREVEVRAVVVVMLMAERELVVEFSVSALQAVERASTV